MALPMPEPAPVTSATRGRQRLRGGHPGELRLLERPVFDAELLRLGDGHVGRDQFGAVHHVDGVDVELARDARGLLVRAEAEHADAGHQHDRWVGAAHRRAVRLGVAVVVGRVVAAVRVVKLAQPGDRDVQLASSVAGRGRGDAPSCGGSGRDTRSRGPPGAGVPPATGSRGRRRHRCSARPAAGRSRRVRGRPGAVPRRPPAAPPRAAAHTRARPVRRDRTVRARRGSAPPSG